MDIFCSIVQGKAPAHVLYHDDHIVAFLDREPETPGHTLIVPRQHIGDILACDEKTLEHIFSYARRRAQELKSEFGYDGFKIFTNTGIFSEIPHFHVHVVGKKIEG